MMSSFEINVQRAQWITYCISFDWSKIICKYNSRRGKESGAGKKRNNHTERNRRDNKASPSISSNFIKFHQISSVITWRTFFGPNEKYFFSSETIKTLEATVVRNSRSWTWSASVWKTHCSGGKKMTRHWPNKEKATAYTNNRLVVNPIEKIDLSCDRQLNALNRSKRTKQVNVIVVSRGVSLLSCKSTQKKNPISVYLISRAIFFLTLFWQKVHFLSKLCVFKV